MNLNFKFALAVLALGFATAASAVQSQSQSELKTGVDYGDTVKSGQVLVELDNQGKKTWECSVTGASHATRLPNGHTLVASMMNRRIVEVDREGKTVKETVTDGRPWKVRRR